MDGKARSKNRHELSPVLVNTESIPAVARITGSVLNAVNRAAARMKQGAIGDHQFSALPVSRGPLRGKMFWQGFANCLNYQRSKNRPFRRPTQRTIMGESLRLCTPAPPTMRVRIRRFGRVEQEFHSLSGNPELHEMSRGFDDCGAGSAAPNIVSRAAAGLAPRVPPRHASFRGAGTA